MQQAWSKILADLEKEFAANASGFAFQRKVSAESPIPGGSRIEDRLLLKGDGELEYSTRGSQTHAGGKEAGLYRAKVTPERVRAFLAILSRADLDSVEPQQVELPSALISLQAIGAGWSAHTVVGKKDPNALRPLAPLFQEIASLIDFAWETPVWAVSLESEIRKTERDRIAVRLDFKNRGSEGVWLTHPFGDEFDRKSSFFRISFVKKKDLPPGVTPIPRPPKYEELELDPNSENLDPSGKLIWIKPGASCVMNLMSRLPEPDGAYLVGTDYASYAGEDHVSGKYRLRGALYSKDTLIQY
jgi:hypothetical protein